MIKTKLMKHQEEILNFIKDKKYFALFADYGIGKSLCILKYIDMNDTIKNVLIIAPKFLILPGNTWDSEIRKHSDFEIIYLNGSYNNKLSTLQNELIVANTGYNRIFLLNYDSLEVAVKFANKFDFVVMDESNYIKNPRTLRTKNAARLCKHINRRAVVSGDPVTENLQDIYSQIFMLDFGASLGKSFWIFNKQFFHQWRFGWLPNKDTKEKITDRIKDFTISKRLNDCIDLPDRVTRDIAINANDEQIRMFKQIHEDYKLTKNDTTITMQYALQTISKLHQICSGFFYKDIVNDNKKSRAVEIFNTLKDTVLLETLKLISPNICIIWCEFNYEIIKLNSLLKSNSFNCISLMSDNKTDMVKEKIKKFRNKKSILIANPKFMGFGETFTEAKYMINYSHGWSYSKRANAEARIYRKGAEIHDKIVYINLYIRDSIEEKILKTLSKKRNLVDILKRYMEDK